MIPFFNQFTKFEKGILLLIFLIYCNNLFLDIMKIDAAQYASISAQMSVTNSYLEVKDFEYNYLDKPPLLFWLSSLSCTVFGINNFAYKFPSFLFLLFSLYAVYRFALLYYTQEIAKNAILILASAQAYFLMTNDVRTDGLLTSSVIISIWLFSEYFVKGRIKNLVFGSVFIGLAMLSKGPIGLVAILMPIGIHLLYHKKWNSIFSFRWLLVLLIVGVLLIPMSYGLYTQFDLQPDKITNGVKGQKGLYFYYWLQSFGRITGESVWDNNKPWSFFITSSLWDFFPWFLPLCFALFFKVKNLFFAKKPTPEIISFVGFIALFAMLSASKYKLPHYVFVTFPFGALLLAEYFSNIKEKIWRNWKIFHLTLGFVILALFIVYPVFLFKEVTFWIFICIIIQVFFLNYYRKSHQNSVAQLIGLVVVLNLFFSFVFYPKLLTFQSDSMAGKWADKNIKNEQVLLYTFPSHSFNFYTKNPFTKVVNKEQLMGVKTPFWLYLSQENLTEISSLKLKITKKISFVDYPITRLKPKFLLADKREKELNHKFLIKVEN
ncbi:glycosyltransferase family 39 protein [Flavobacterium sp.]|uniref:ArnT family glycosyltransferase n=1 Tax=Flavobacterium sp. TaxID=239 RepID=UPI00286DF8E6|nr:glycosyltransferase family 39 protein [Flavobacterium sp.]